MTHSGESSRCPGGGSSRSQKGGGACCPHGPCEWEEVAAVIKSCDLGPVVLLQERAPRSCLCRMQAVVLLAQVGAESSESTGCVPPEGSTASAIRWGWWQGPHVPPQQDFGVGQPIHRTTEHLPRSGPGGIQRRSWGSSVEDRRRQDSSFRWLAPGL